MLHAYTCMIHVYVNAYDTRVYMMPVGYMRICVRVYDACVYVFACMVHVCTRMYDVCVCMVHACTCMCTCFYVYTCVVPVYGIHVYSRSATRPEVQCTLYKFICAT